MAVLFVFICLLIFSLFLWSLSFKKRTKISQSANALDLEARPNAIEKHLAEHRAYYDSRIKPLEPPSFVGVRSDDLRHLLDFLKSSKSLLAFVRPRSNQQALVADYVGRGGLHLFSTSATFWMLQCYLLTTIKWISSDFHCHRLSDKSSKLLGCSMADLYPVVIDNQSAFIIYSLLFDLGYGPNLFPWHRYRVDEDDLCGHPRTLYLVSIDVGTLAGQEPDCIWKIGITAKSVVGKNARYSGKYSSVVQVLREICYGDGRIAFMKEQIYLDMAPDGIPRYVLEPWQYRMHDIDLIDEMGIDPSKYLSRRDVGTLGTSEWVFGKHKTPRSAIALFDRLTQWEAVS